MELDVMAFAKNIKAIGEKEPFTFESSGVKYLYELMLRYAATGNSVLSVSDVDFEAFNVSDCDGFLSFFEDEIAGDYKTANKVADIFKSAAPKAQAAARLFF